MDIMSLLPKTQRMPQGSICWGRQCDSERCQVIIAVLHTWMIMIDGSQTADE